ncbi:uncharacterized protein Dwil_GK19315, partial [Drosophila willistoni]
FRELFFISLISGSSGDDLKVGKPDEYDIVFYVILPHLEDIKVLRDSSMPGNVHLDITDILKHRGVSDKSDNIFQWLESLVNDKNLIVVQKLQDWIKSIVARVINQMQNRFVMDGQVCQLEYKNCGPAHTIYLTGAYKYSVDYVPAIYLKAEKNIINVNESHLFENQTHFEAIPKPMKPFRADSTSFRCSYYDAERSIIKNNEIFKTAIKFVKRFRDVKSNMSNFKSYYIKILLLRLVTNNPDLHAQPLTVVLFRLFEEMENCLRSGNLPFFWHPELNMLSILTREQIQEMFIVARNHTKCLYDIINNNGVYRRLEQLRFFFSKL